MGDIYPHTKGFTFIAIGIAVASADRCPDIRADRGLCLALARPGAITGVFGAELIRRTFTVVLAGWSGWGRALSVVGHTYAVCGSFAFIAVGLAVTAADRSI